MIMANSVGVGFPSTNLQKGHTFHDLDEGATYIFLGGPPRLASSWRLVNGIFPNNPDTTLWGASQAGATWYNLSLNSLMMWTGTEAVRVRDSNSPYTVPDYRRQLVVQEDFLGGTNTSGNFGSSGFNGFSGTTTIIVSEPPYIGLIRRATGAVAGTIASIGLGGTSNLIPTTLDMNCLWIARLNTVDADVIMRIGMMNSMTTNPPALGAYFEKLAADVNWFMVNRETNISDTRVDTGIPVNTSFTKFEISRSGATSTFKINGVTLGSISLTPPVGNVNPACHVSNGAAAADKTADFDLCRFVTDGTIDR